MAASYREHQWRGSQPRDVGRPEPAGPHPPLVAAGVPVLQRRSPGCAVAAQRLVSETGIGVLYDDPDDLAAQLGDRAAMDQRRARAWVCRHQFTFDHHTDRLVELFRRIAR
jgi:glycosyltransferase involved in cell wall biosynthesis